ncbi:bifunctional precorrin-2 dehydrogenase/sirohydrochlorin ferrochelatase [Thermoplasma sp.]|uniref:precorrin-2 dehydrogenase/sirohydrochlorin ferrochelatase family protein n=1 Tax=Thermoplasma sp. TaxID=1973142 RepID=UPI0025F32ED6|nr:bifunctional precorrin-2 dehydrogenase/sirohydrochlorin ferrochelatase [Thermoplasma sp.]
MLNTDDRYVLIIGGGNVGLRKATKLLETGCKITVVSERFVEGFRHLNARLIERKIERPEDIMDLFAESSMTVIALDDRNLAETIAAYCSSNRILYNRVDVIDSPIIFPAFIKKDDLVISVSTSGASPSLASYVLSRISVNIDVYARAAKVLGAFRKRILDMTQEEKKDLFESILNNDEFWQTVETGSLRDAFIYISRIIEKSDMHERVGEGRHEAETQ